MPRNGPKMTQNDPKCPKNDPKWPSPKMIRTFSAIFFDWKGGSANFFAFRMIGGWVRIAASLDFTFLLQHRQFVPSVSAIFVRRKIDKESFVSELFSVPYIWYQYLHMFWALLISQMNNNSQTIKKGWKYGTDAAPALWPTFPSGAQYLLATGQQVTPARS